jgi:hypothetical protein
VSVGRSIVYVGHHALRLIIPVWISLTIIQAIVLRCRTSNHFRCSLNTQPVDYTDETCFQLLPSCYVLIQGTISALRAFWKTRSLTFGN